MLPAGGREGGRGEAGGRWAGPPPGGRRGGGKGAAEVRGKEVVSCRGGGRPVARLVPAGAGGTGGRGAPLPPPPRGRHVLCPRLVAYGEKMASAALTGEAGALSRAPTRSREQSFLPGAGVWRDADPAPSPALRVCVGPSRRPVFGHYGGEGARGAWSPARGKGNGRAAPVAAVSRRRERPRPAQRRRRRCEARTCRPEAQVVSWGRFCDWKVK